MKKNWVSLLTLMLLLTLGLGLSVTAGAEYTDDCITFSSGASFTLYAHEKGWPGVLYYSTDKTTWTEWDGMGISAGESGGTYYLYLRGNDKNTVITGHHGGGGWWLTQDHYWDPNISCTGNIETLRGATGGSPSKMQMGACCYAGLFSECRALDTAPSLPATTLAEGCYREMFRGCTSLWEAPVISATILAESCCERMFEGCTSLTNATVLPATTMAERCYNRMFCDCTSLTKAPVLPATLLEDYCYEEMFCGCSSLTKPPVLPAMTLEDGCYSRMFYGCTSLTKTPVLPATILEDYCYESMFEGCTTLLEPAMMDHVTSLAECCCEYMYAGCSNLVVNEDNTMEGYTKPWKFCVTDISMGGIATGGMFESTGGSLRHEPEAGRTYYIRGEGPSASTQSQSITASKTDCETKAVKFNFRDKGEVSLTKADGKNATVKDIIERLYPESFAIWDLLDANLKLSFQFKDIPNGESFQSITLE